MMICGIVVLVKTMTEILYEDKYCIACVKKPGMLSEECDSPESLPLILRNEHNTDIFTLHRLDKPVGGVILYAKNKKAASAFSSLITENRLTKTYLAVLDGTPEKDEDRLCDLLFKDSRKNKTFVVKKMRKGVRDAALRYTVTERSKKNTLVKVTLETGRSHQIRVQFASRKLPLTGDGKYGSRDNGCTIALWSHILEFDHPVTGEHIVIESNPDYSAYPWNLFRK